MLSGSGEILGHVVLSQDVHEVYGGVVPELAARAHLQKVDSVVDEALARASAGRSTAWEALCWRLLPEE